MTENFQIQTKNYKLNLKQEHKVQLVVQALIRKIPYNSIIRINLEYQKNNFTGKLEILTNKKIFYSHDSAPTVALLMKGLSKKVGKQVMRWKQSRTKKDVTGIHDLNEFKQHKYFRQAS